MQIIFKKIEPTKDGRKPFGTLDENGNPIVNEELEMENPRIAEIVFTHENEHRRQGPNGQGSIYAQAKAHLAAFRKATNEGKGAIPSQPMTEMGHSVVRHLGALGVLYRGKGGDTSFEDNPNNRSAMCRAEWQLEEYAERINLESEV